MFKVAKAVVPMSADPGIAGVRPVAVDRDHAAICKPLDRDDPVYEGTLAFLEDDALAPRSPMQSENIAEILRIVSEKESVPLKTLQAILASMTETMESPNAAQMESPNFAQIEQKLTATASKFRELTDRLNRLSNADPDVARLRKEASAALAEGLFAQADQLLANAEARDLSGLEDFEALARQKRLSAAESRAGRAVAAMLRINPDAYRQAAAHYAEASRIAAVADTLKGREYLRSQATTLVTLGEEFGDNSALQEAIRLLEPMLAVSNQARDPLDWAGAQMNLGTGLATLGNRETGTARLEEAVAAFREALQERTRARVPLDWARTTGDQGVALMLLAERRGDAKMAKLAVQQIEAAFMTSRDGGDAPSAAYYKVQLPNARALVQKLAKR
jgi:hypothetical protein